MYIISKKNITIKDVAALAEVSISVVSYVLNDSKEKSISDPTKQKVLEAVKQLGYVPNNIARGMRTQKSMSIGIVSFWDVSEYVFINILSGILEVCTNDHYTITLCTVKNAENDFSYMDYYTNKRIDGIIFISPPESLINLNEKAHIEQMKSNNIPFVIINGHTKMPDTHYVNIDYFGSALKATEYLITKGHNNISFVGNLDDKSFEAQERLKGYHYAMKKALLQSTIYDITEVANNISYLKAVVANKSGIAHYIIGIALKNKIIIPTQLALIAANTENYSKYLYPPLTSVRVPTKEMGQIAASTLIETIQGRFI